MVHFTASLAVVAAAALIAAAAPAPSINKRIAVPVRKGTSGLPISAKDVVQRDLARIAAYNSKTSVHGLEARQSSGKAVNTDVSYLAAIEICSKTYNLIVDTGSSNLWAGASTKVSSSCGTSTGKSFSVSYGSGSVKGTERLADVTYAGLTVSKQSFGAASSATGFTGVDGIIGFGPVDLTSSTVSGTSSIPTFMDNLYSQGLIDTEAVGIYFAPESGSDTDDANGELTLGGADDSKYSGDLTYYATSESSPYSDYWGIDTTGISFGSTSLSSSASAIVDTGTTLIYIPTTAYNKFLKAASGTTDSSSGLAVFTKKPTASFTIKINGDSYPLTPAQYLVPTAQYSYYGLTSGKYYSWIYDGGSSSADVNFIIGQKFLENYYSVFDTTNSQIGFAPRV